MDVRTELGRFEWFIDDSERSAHPALIADDINIATPVKGLPPTLHECGQTLREDETGHLPKPCATQSQQAGNVDPSPTLIGVEGAQEWGNIKGTSASKDKYRTQGKDMGDDATRKAKAKAKAKTRPRHMEHGEQQWWTHPHEE